MSRCTLAVLAAGCSPASDADGRRVLLEQERLSSLSDPAVLTTAMQAPDESLPTDHGRWPGQPNISPSTQPASRAATTQPALQLTIEQAVLMALDQNRNLVVQRYAPRIAEYAEQASLAQYDPTLTGSASYSRSGLAIAPAVPDFQSINAQAQVQQFFATGTTVAVGLSTAYQGTHLYGDGRTATGSLRAGINVTQSLLQGAGLEFNLASVRQAQLDVLTSQYELRGVAEQLASDTEQAYLDCVLNQRELEIARNALQVAQIQLDETDAMIHSGRSASSDRAAALATVAQRDEELIDARATLDQTRLRFIQLINPSAENGSTAWDSDLKLNQPAVPVGPLDPVESHLQIARLYRSDVNQARLQVQRGDLQIVQTRNGLLPRLDVFASLGRTWYSHYPEETGYGDPTSYDATAGVNFAYPFFNRAALAAHHSAQASRDEAIGSLANLQQLVEFDVCSSYQEVLRAKQQISASAAAMSASEAALQVEQERYQVGKSTSLLVSVAQQQQLSSQIAKATAVAGYLKGLVNLYRLEGSLLERRGIVSLDYPPENLHR
jgi:outer membrane protein